METSPVNGWSNEIIIRSAMSMTIDVIAVIEDCIKTLSPAKNNVNPIVRMAPINRIDQSKSGTIPLLRFVRITLDEFILSICLNNSLAT